MKYLRNILAALLVAGAVQGASAQYWELANQLPGLVRPALSGSLNYKGFVEFSGIAGLGHNRANFLELSTSQGFRYADWFYMGVGIGIDVVMGQTSDRYIPDGDDAPGYFYRQTSKTKAMMPVFSDFRFSVGGPAARFFADLKLGAAWLLGNEYLQMNDACLGTGAQFYFKPTIGVRLPVNSQNPRQAINIGITYQLLTSNNNYYWYDNSLTLHALGASVSYEW